MFAYLVVIVGRPQQLFSTLSSLPFAKLTFACALLVALKNRSSPSVRLARIPVARTTLYFFGLCVVSVLYSIWPVHSLKMVLFGITVLAASFVLIVKLATNWTSVRIMIGALPISAAILAANILLTYSGVRPSGTAYYDPNDLAFVLVVIFPVVCALIVSTRKLRKLCYIAIATMLIVATLLTESRGGLLGMCSVVLSMAILSINPRTARLPRAPRLRRIAINIFLAGVVSLVAWQGTPYIARTRLDTVLHLRNDYNFTSVGGRISIWERNVEATILRPIGFGVGSFAMVDLRTGGHFKAPHNILVQVFVELGVVGLWLFLRIFFQSWRGLRYAENCLDATQDLPASLFEQLAICRGLSFSLIGMFVCGFFLSEAFTNEVWALFAVIAAAIAAHPAPTYQQLSRSAGLRSRIRRSPTSRMNGTRESYPARFP